MLSISDRKPSASALSARDRVWKLRHIIIIQTHPLGIICKCNQFCFKMLDIRLIQTSIGSNKKSEPRPEILFYVMLFQARTNRIAFSYINSWQFTLF